MELTERDKAILEFERSWWSEGGPKETLIAERFDLSAGRYYQILGELLDSDAAYAHDPLVVRRLRRQRDRRHRARQAAADVRAPAVGESSESHPVESPPSDGEVS
jgi:hypothetical protein